MLRLPQKALSFCSATFPFLLVLFQFTSARHFFFPAQEVQKMAAEFPLLAFFSPLQLRGLHFLSTILVFSTSLLQRATSK